MANESKTPSHEPKTHITQNVSADFIHKLKADAERHRAQSAQRQEDLDVCQEEE